MTFLKLILTPTTKNVQKTKANKTSAKMERFGAITSTTRDDFTESVKSLYTVETKDFHKPTALFHRKRQAQQGIVITLHRYNSVKSTDGVRKIRLKLLVTVTSQSHTRNY